MTKCQNCGNLNTQESIFCRFCGTRFMLGPQPGTFAPPERQIEPESTDFPAPRPYSWKTDEFSIQNEARKTVGGTMRIQAPGVTSHIDQARPQQLAQRPPQQVSQPYRCPHCGSPYLPQVERRISTAGWVTFALLLVFMFPLFWIGFFVKEDVRICPNCQIRVG